MSEIILKNKLILKITIASVNDAEYMMEYANIIGGETDYMGYGKNELPFTLDNLKKQIESAIESKNDQIIIGKIKNKIVSLASIKSEIPKRRKHIGVLGISVLMEYWRIGIASALINYLINWVKYETELKKLSLEVFAENTRAIKLYEKFGFRMEGKLSMTYKIEEKYYDSLIMALIFAT